MQSTLRRQPLVLIAILLIVFFGAGGLGLGLAKLLAPESHLAAFVSFLFLPFALILGFHAWLGLAVLILIPRLFIRLLRGAGAVSQTNRRGDVIPPGRVAFLPTASGVGLVAGVLVGIVSSTHGFWFVLAIYWAVGTIYGGVLWALARSGYLPFPESG